MGGDALRTAFLPVPVTPDQRQRAMRTLARMADASDAPDKAGALREALLACGLVVPTTRIRGVSHG